MISNNQRAVTLVELAFIVAIIGMAMALVRVSVKFVSDMFKQSSQIGIDRDAQMTLHWILRDIRNCKDIISVSDDKLVLQMFNTEKGYDVLKSPIFDTSKTSTVTYQYVSVTAPKTTTTRYLQRTLQTTTNNSKIKLLPNLISAPSANNPMFRISQGANPSAPQSIDIAIRFADGYWRDSPRLFEAQGMKRSDSDF